MEKCDTCIAMPNKKNSNYIYICICFYTFMLLPPKLLLFNCMKNIVSFTTSLVIHVY